MCENGGADRSRLEQSIAEQMLGMLELSPWCAHRVVYAAVCCCVAPLRAGSALGGSRMRARTEHCVVFFCNAAMVIGGTAVHFIFCPSTLKTRELDPMQLISLCS